MSTIDAERILEELPIVHVHGILGKYPKTPYEPYRDINELLDISQQIKIIHEISDQDEVFCNEMFEQAYKWLSSTERIFFLGFGFHPDNIRRFRFFKEENTKGKTLRSTSVGLIGLDQARLIKRLSISGFPVETFDGAPLIDCDMFFQSKASLD